MISVLSTILECWAEGGLQIQVQTIRVGQNGKPLTVIGLGSIKAFLKKKLVGQICNFRAARRSRWLICQTFLWCWSNWSNYEE